MEMGFVSHSMRRLGWTRRLRDFHRSITRSWCLGWVEPVIVAPETLEDVLSERFVGLRGCRQRGLSFPSTLVACDDGRLEAII